MKRALHGLQAVVLLAAAAGVLAAQQSNPGDSPGAPPPGALALVNGEPIYAEDLERRLTDMHTGMAETQRSAYDLDRLVARLVNDTLLAQEARTLGMQEEEPIPTRLAALRRRLAVERLEQEEIWQPAEPSEEEVRRAFAEEYRTASFHVLTVADLEEARRLEGELRAGADFEELARRHSTDQYASRGGRVESRPRIDLPSVFSEVLFALRPGEIGAPVETALGWVILRVDSIGEPAADSFAGAESRIRDRLRPRKAETLRQALGDRLQEAYPVSVDWQAVEAITCEATPIGRLMPRVEEPEAVVARIEESTIRAADLGRALRRRWAGVRDEQAALAARPLVLDRMIREELMAAEALRRGYGATDEALRSLGAYEKQLLVPRYLTKVLGPQVEITDEEMAEHYRQNRARYARPPRFHLGQITVASEEEAERLAALLRQGADLGWLARRHSIDRFRQQGGDRGWVTASSVVAPEELAEAGPGDVLGPKGTPGSFIVQQVNAREEQGSYSFEEAAGRVRSEVFALKFGRLIEEILIKLREASEIEVYDEAVAALDVSGRLIGGGAEGTAPPPGHGGR